jgi:hypothetical protein
MNKLWRTGRSEALVVKGKGHPLHTNSGASGERRYGPSHSLTTALEGGEWLTTRPAAFTPGKIHGTHCTGGWVGPRAGLDAETRGKTSAPVEDRTPAVQLVVRHYTDCATRLIKALVSFYLITANNIQASCGFPVIKAGFIWRAWLRTYNFP